MTRSRLKKAKNEPAILEGSVLARNGPAKYVTRSEYMYELCVSSYRVIRPNR